jgi:hypothetical protein
MPQSRRFRPPGRVPPLPGRLGSPGRDLPASPVEVSLGRREAAPHHLIEARILAHEVPLRLTVEVLVAFEVRPPTRRDIITQATARHGGEERLPLRVQGQEGRRQLVRVVNKQPAATGRVRLLLPKADLVQDRLLLGRLDLPSSVLR